MDGSAARSATSFEHPRHVVLPPQRRPVVEMRAKAGQSVSQSDRHRLETQLRHLLANINYSGRRRRCRLGDKTRVESTAKRFRTLIVILRGVIQLGRSTTLVAPSCTAAD